MGRLSIGSLIGLCLGSACNAPPLVMPTVEPTVLLCEEIPLRYIRPYLAGRPTPDVEIIRFLENQLSEAGSLEYDADDNRVVIRDRERNVHAARLLVRMFDYSGLPLPDGLRHLPLELDEGSVNIVPALPD